MKPLIAVAPMMDWTDRYCRYFLRLIAPSIQLYTEMITAQALIHGDSKRLLEFHPAEHPVVLQLGGSDPQLLSKAAMMGEREGYDEINLNVGCPSDRVSSGRFGACLMLTPLLVSECIAEMKAKVNLPVTVKCRIGVDDQDSEASLHQFIETVSKAGCTTFIIHARKALLKGLSPKQNREIPPLQYDRVWQVKKNFPHLTIIINGGIHAIDQVEDQLTQVDGVMIGREAYSRPYFLAELQTQYFPEQGILSRHEIVHAMLPYIETQLKEKIRLNTITRHLLGLFQGMRGAAIWRRYLSEHAHKTGAGIEVIEQALLAMAQCAP